jgi:hypothetical protein
LRPADPRASAKLIETNNGVRQRGFIRLRSVHGEGSGSLTGKGRTGPSFVICYPGAMSPSAEPWQPILDTLAKLQAAWPTPGWSWDHRFKCVTSSFAGDSGPAVRAVLAAAVPSEWTAESFPTAPDEVRALGERCGDLRPGQLLLTGNVVAGMILFAMWWPWGDGSQISVRVGIANSDRPKDLYPAMRAQFGIA